MKRQIKVKIYQTYMCIMLVVLGAVLGYVLCSDKPPIIEQKTETIYVEVEKPENRYSDLELSDTDIELIACMVYLEARGEDFTGQRMVAEVILNRVISDKFPNTVSEVIYQQNQFQPVRLVDGTTPTIEQYEAVKAALNDEHPITNETTLFFSRGAYNTNIFATIGNHVFCDI